MEVLEILEYAKTNLHVNGTLVAKAGLHVCVAPANVCVAPAIQITVISKCLNIQTNLPRTREHKVLQTATSEEREAFQEGSLI